jgi:hypothetical protein
MSAQRTAPTTPEAAIWGRLIRPEAPDFSPETARSLLALDFGPADRARMNDLAVKARKGTLTEAEDQELDGYIRVGHVLGLLHAKARRALRNGASTRDAP